MRFVEISIVTPTFDATVEFYRRFLGAPPVRRTDHVQVFALGGVELFVHRGGRGHQPNAEHFKDHLGFEVEDVDHACEELRARGLTIDAGPETYYWGRSAYLRDPDERQVELAQARQPSSG